MNTTKARDNWFFSKEGDAFFLNTTEPPRDWQNVHYTEQGIRGYYSIVSFSGTGPVFVRDEDGNKTFLNSEGGAKTIYFRLEDTGAVWSIAGYPVPTPVEDYRCEFTPSYTRLQSRYDGIACSWRVFAPMGQLFEIWTVEVANQSAARKTVSLFPYSGVDLTGFNVLFRYGKERMRWAAYHDDIQGMFAKNRSPFAPSDIYSVFLVSSEKPIAATAKPNTLFTLPHSFTNPNLDGKWKDRFVPAYEACCLCMKIPVTLEAGEKKTLQFAFGTAPEVERVAPIQRLIQDPAKVETLLQEVVDYYKALRAPVQLKTGDERIDRFFNFWAPKQIENYLVSKKAFRDNLQVDMAYCALNYQKALENVKDALSFQYDDGHAPHSFHPVVHIQYSDKPTWIPMAVAELVKESGDFSVLDIELPYINAKGEKTGNGTILDHIRRSMRFLFNDIGVHKINLMHYADWLDGLDGLSRVGEGESVLVSMMFAAGLIEVMKLAEAIGNEELRREAAEMHAEVKRRINENGWDGEWYLRGYSGNGEKVGSKENKYGQIFQNAQSWAIIGGVADKDRARMALDSVDRILETPLGRRLYGPSYREYFHHIGCISAQPPDYAMNAIYQHACAFNLVAECMAGRPEKAWSALDRMVPDCAANPSTQSRCEPYTITNCYYLEKNYYGEAVTPWRTGTVGWAHRGLVEFMLGVRKDYKGLRIQPCLPARIKTASVRRVFRGNTYHIEIDNTSGRCQGAPRILVNGAELKGAILPLGAKGAEHRVRVIV